MFFNILFSFFLFFCMFYLCCVFCAFLYWCLYCFSFRICSCLFPTYVQVYRPLLLGEKPISVNEYHTILYCTIKSIARYVALCTCYMYFICWIKFVSLLFIRKISVGVTNTISIDILNQPQHTLRTILLRGNWLQPWHWVSSSHDTKYEYIQNLNSITWRSPSFTNFMLF
jgi:hypothetical protein